MKASPERQRWKRLNLPCDNCRDRKKRCDGTRPICLACERRGAGDTCVYTKAQKRQTAERPSIASGNKIKSASPLAGHANDGASPVVKTDGMATFIMHDDGASYGLSSTQAFLRNILSNAELEDMNDEHRSPSPAPVSTTRKSPTKSNLPPSAAAQDECFRCFWEFVHPSVPMLFRPHVESSYRQLRGELCMESFAESTRDIGAAIMVSSIYLCLALGCRFCARIDREQKESMREYFYRRSRAAFTYDILDNTSLPIVQMLLLSIVYLQSKSEASRSWNTMGLAVRMCESLGVHNDAYASKEHSSIMREMSRRVWYGCVILDRLSAMAFGRPAMIKYQYNVPLPSMASDDDLMASPSINYAVNENNFFVASGKLLTYVPEISDIYHTISQSDPSTSEQEFDDEILARILEVNRKLDKYWASLPTDVRLSSKEAAPESGAQALQRHTFHGRFLLVRIWLHRPLLARSLKQSSDYGTSTRSSLDEQIVQNCCHACVKAACQIIDLMHEHLETTYRSSDSLVVYFCFAAGLVILAYEKCNFAMVSVQDATEMQQSFSRSLYVLEYHRDRIDSAVQASRALKLVKRKMQTNSNTPSSMFATTNTYMNDAVDGRIDIRDIFAADAFPVNWLDGSLQQYDSLFT